MIEDEIDFWEKKSKEAIGEWKKDIETWKSQNRGFWKHLTLVNATVLGFTVGINQIKNVIEPNIFLVLAWIFLIFSIALGLFLLKEDQDIKFKADFDSFRFQYNMAEISKRDKMGKITQEEKLGLMLAVMSDNQVMNLKKENLHFTEKAEALILKFKDKLPTSEFLEPIPGKNKTWDNPIKLWILKNQLNLANFLYYTTIISYVFLFLSIVSGPRDLIIKFFLEKLRK